MKKQACKSGNKATYYKAKEWFVKGSFLRVCRGCKTAEFLKFWMHSPLAGSSQFSSKPNSHQRRLHRGLLIFPETCLR